MNDQGSLPATGHVSSRISHAIWPNAWGHSFKFLLEIQTQSSSEDTLSMFLTSTESGQTVNHRLSRALLFNVFYVVNHVPNTKIPGHFGPEFYHQQLGKLTPRLCCHLISPLTLILHSVNEVELISGVGHSVREHKTTTSQNTSN